VAEPASGPARSCRCCGAALRRTFVDLGMSPLCERYVPAEKLNDVEPFYPLRVYACEECFLFQMDEYLTSVTLGELARTRTTVRKRKKRRRRQS